MCVCGCRCVFVHPYIPYPYSFYKYINNEIEIFITQAGRCGDVLDDAPVADDGFVAPGER